ncbi:hypothetical protein ACIRVK_13715 [Streptomyces sp. NPDC101152]|uniref:hypothetical protein n=1 Tax=Streptomyces sp. NPDC101152 TaxID=3366116 RepID=UPI00382A6313
MTTTDDPPLIMWGRCRSGRRRWFWTTRLVGDPAQDVHGWADSPDQASREANTAALRLGDGRYAHVHVRHSVATDKLRHLNAAKRTAKAPKANPSKVMTPPAEPIGWLYAVEPGRYDLDDQTWLPGKVVSFPITRKTSRRVYYLRPRGPFEWEAGYVDRQELERDGSVPVARWLVLFAEPPEIPKPVVPPGLKELKAAMAASHPDRGGSAAEFIKARAEYVKARDRAKTSPRY